MTGGKAIVLALAGLPTLCAFLISRKLVEMLFTNELYRLRREGLVDKTERPFTHALHVCAFAFCFMVSLGFIWLCLSTALHDRSS